MKARADMAEMDAAEKRGQLIPAAEVEKAWIEAIAVIRSRLLALPDKVAPMAFEATSIPAARDALKAAIYDALTEVSHIEIEDESEAAPAAGSEAGVEELAGIGGAAAEPDGEPMGRQLPPAEL